AQEYATTSTNAENVTPSTPDQSAPSKQRSQLSGYVTSPALPSEESLTSTQLQSNLAPEISSEESQQQEIYSTPELQRSHSVESSTSTQLQSNLTPKIFLEESEQQQESTQKPKRRQRKGCLYKYIENKKLKSGAITSYPRVMGHRDPDNPKHWRWGFNWEEKVDGEWKGRSIGSVPIGVIALIQSMQKEGVSLEEIIGFIKRSKNKG
ncbi:MAG: hypothetical protein ICV78_18875, partial [Tolypothrix sp. Co-bin9]|nr:hypothetical protein [Tolypothrix sp. Co-bin9]